ncbi:MAG: hypothetical protein ACHP9Y_01005 [Gammaproteobacteria bacterium]
MLKTYRANLNITRYLEDKPVIKDIMYNYLAGTLIINYYGSSTENPPKVGKVIDAKFSQKEPFEILPLTRSVIEGGCMDGYVDIGYQYHLVAENDSNCATVNNACFAIMSLVYTTVVTLKFKSINLLVPLSSVIFSALGVKYVSDETCQEHPTQYYEMVTTCLREDQIELQQDF